MTARKKTSSTPKLTDRVRRYEVRWAFQVGGVSALLEQQRGPKGPHPNRVAPEIEEKILAYCLARPTHGAQRVANKLRLQGVQVSPSGVRGVWLRHGLETRTQRLLRLENGVPVRDLRPERGADPAPGAPQPGLPLPSHRSLPSR